MRPSASDNREVDGIATNHGAVGDYPVMRFFARSSDANA
jgi:hypothetical protein